jgi:hypothetical protein
MVPPELQRQAADSLLTKQNAARCHQRFNISNAQGKPEV